MAGPPDNRGPPDFVDIPDAAALDDVLDGQDLPYGIRFSQGDSEAMEVFESVDTSRGADIAELHYPDGRHVTVDVPTQVNGVTE